MSSLRRSFLAAATLAAGIGLGLAPAAAQKVIKLSHLNPADPIQSHSGAMTSVFKSLVEAGTNGSVTVQLFPDGQLGKDNEVIQMTRDNVIQSNISSSGGVAQHYPLVGVFDMPFAFPNIAVAHEVIDLDNAFGRKFATDIEAKTGLKVIGLLDSGGFFAISNSKRPIRSVEDMKGLRIRTMTLPTLDVVTANPEALGYGALIDYGPNAADKLYLRLAVGPGREMQVQTQQPEEPRTRPAVAVFET